MTIELRYGTSCFSYFSASGTDFFGTNTVSAVKLYDPSENSGDVYIPTTVYFFFNPIRSDGIIVRLICTLSMFERK
ncbi:unknown [Anaerotruncus sp. CAG:390]|nr:unknown [Anaerotruncus sp. CAG:390]